MVRPLNYQVLNVRPSNHGVAPKETRYDFADYDLCVPPVFVTTALFIQLPLAMHKEKMIAALQGGLSHTLGQIPIFAGKLQYDAKSLRPYASLHEDTTVSLGIRHLDDTPSSSSTFFSSFHQWEEADYPIHELVRQSDILYPPGVQPSNLPFGVRKETGCVMSAFQINFIKGGIILVSTFHHWQGDAASCDMFCNVWSENTKAISNASPNLSTFRASFDRTYFTKPVDKVDEERGRKLLQEVMAYRPAHSQMDSNAAMQKASYQLQYRSFHVSKAKITRLKRMYTATATDNGKYVSTWDCLAALTWRAVMKARQPMHPEWNKAVQTTRLTSAVNVRNRFNVVPEQYIGNGWARGHTNPMTIDTLLSKPLEAVAWMSRKSILDVSPATIPNVVELSKYAEDKTSLTADIEFQFGSDLLATSWAQMKIRDYDFGFGSVKSFRGVAGQLEGMLLYPQDNGPRGEEKGCTIGVQLEASCLARLCQDEELLAFCELR